MKTVFTKSELPHVWAKQSQEEGRTPTKNMFFINKDIYSYGYHFCMARIVDTTLSDGAIKQVVLITDRKYSVTTASQLSQVRYAVNHLERIYVPYPEKKLSHSDNAKAIISRIKEQLDILGNTRKRPQTKDAAKVALANIVSNVEKFAAVTGEKINSKWSDKDLQKEFKLYFNAAKNEKASEQLADKLNKLAVAKKKEETKKQLQAIEDWKNGDGYGSIYSGKVYLRVSPLSHALNHEEVIPIVETSKGARVSFKAAKVLFDRIHAGKDVIGFEIDGYTVLGINGVLTIGCHKIEREEIERFAKTQGWI